MKPYAPVVCIANTYAGHLLAVALAHQAGDMVPAAAAEKHLPCEFGLLHAAGLVTTATPAHGALTAIRLTRAGEEYLADALTGTV